MKLAEIEAGADALKAVWEENEAMAAREARPAGLSWIFMARTVLEAAGKVRGKVVLDGSETIQ